MFFIFDCRHPGEVSRVAKKLPALNLVDDNSVSLEIFIVARALKHSSFDLVNRSRLQDCSLLKESDGWPSWRPPFLVLRKRRETAAE